MLAARPSGASAAGSSSSRRRATRLPFADAVVRPPHVHLPAALRRRSRRHAARACPRRPARRHDRGAGVRRARAAPGARSGISMSDVGLPLAGRLISPGWHEVGRFLGPSIRDVLRAAPARAAARALGDGRDRDVRRARLSLGGGVVIWGRRVSAERRHAPRARRSTRSARAAGATSSTLLHLPYTAWHLAYVVVGGCLAPRSPGVVSASRSLAFSLAMGIGAHALDELDGRPLATRDPRPRARRAGRRLGRRGVRDRDRGRASSFSLWILPLVAVGAVPRPGVQPRAVRRPLPHGPLVRARLGRLPGRHRRTSPAPGTLRVEAVLAAARGRRCSRSRSGALSTPVRRLRREVDGGRRRARARGRDGRARHAGASARRTGRRRSGC